MLRINLSGQETTVTCDALGITLESSDQEIREAVRSYFHCSQTLVEAFQIKRADGEIRLQKAE
jgi:hypothetical protein